MGEVLIRGGTVLDPASPLVEADIRIDGSTITEVGRGLRAAPGATVIDAAGMIAMPGLVNAHTHSGQNLDRGVAPNLPLDLWMIWVVYGGLMFTAEDAYVLAKAGAAEMLSTGCTAVLDHPWVPPDAFAEHGEALVQAYADAGIRAGISPMLQDRDFFESISLEGVDGPRPEPFGAAIPAGELMAMFTAWYDRWHGVHPRVVPMSGVSAPQRCSDELMAMVGRFTVERGAQFHTHVLETKSQIVATRERYGRSVVTFLGEQGLLSAQCSYAHCVWMDTADFTAVRDAGAVVVHNPISNLRCGSGLLPLGDLLRGGVKVAIGVDGAASNDNQNVFEALKFAGLIHTLYGDHRRWPRAVDVWQACLAGGAAALGAPIGRIAPGSHADLVLLDTNRHVVADKDATATSLVLAEHGESVHTVIVGGEVVIEDRAWARIDRAELCRQTQALQRRIADNLPARQAVYDRHEDLLCRLHDRDTAMPTDVRRLADVSPAFG